MSRTVLIDISTWDSKMEACSYVRVYVCITVTVYKQAIMELKSRLRSSLSNTVVLDILPIRYRVADMRVPTKTHWRFQRSLVYNLTRSHPRFLCQHTCVHLHDQHSSYLVDSQFADFTLLLSKYILNICFFIFGFWQKTAKFTDWYGLWINRLWRWQGASPIYVCLYVLSYVCALE